MWVMCHRTSMHRDLDRIHIWSKGTSHRNHRRLPSDLGQLSSMGMPSQTTSSETAGKRRRNWAIAQTHDKQGTSVMYISNRPSTHASKRDLSCRLFAAMHDVLLLLSSAAPVWSKVLANDVDCPERSARAAAAVRDIARNSASQARWLT